MKWVIIIQGASYLINVFSQGDAFWSLLMFEPSLVLHGQVWRLFGFLLIPSQNNLLFLAISFFFYYWVGSSLEQDWGRMKFTVFYLGGSLCCVLYALLCTGLYAVNLIGPIDTLFVAESLNLSLLLAFGTVFPDIQVRVYFVLPVRVKWLAVVAAGITVVQLAFPPYSLYSFFPLACVANYLVFFAADLIGLLRRTSVNRAKTVSFKHKVRQARAEKGYVHKCAVCGLTDADAPGMEFRYCSLCSGYQCYCSQHIFAHEHKKG